MKSCRLLYRMVVLLLAFNVITLAYAEQPTPIDLRSIDFSGGQPHSLHEDWQVFWGKLLKPQDFVDQTLSPDAMIPMLSGIPGDHASNPEKFRYGTFRTTIISSENMEAPALYLPEIRGAMTLWVNGVKRFSQGKVAASADHEISEMRAQLLELDRSQTRFELVLQISSFEFQELGPMIPIKIAPASLMRTHMEDARLRDIFVLSAILIMAFYHIALYLLRKSRPEPLFFGLFCIGVIGMTSVRGEGQIIYKILDNPSAHLFYRYDFASLGLAIIAISYYCRLLYPKQIWWKLGRLNVLVSAIFLTVALFAPFWLIDILLKPYQAVFLTGAFVYLANIVRATWQRERDSLLFLFGFILIIAGGVNDILRTNGLADVPTISHLTLFGFIFIQAVILSKRFSKAFDQLEVAEGEIRQLNANLESKVEERTATIRMILDHVKSGFLLIDKDQKVMDGFTRSCSEIFGSSIAAGRGFDQLFDLQDSQRLSLQLGLEQVFDDLMPEEVTLGQIPSRLPVGDRQVMVQASVIRDDAGEIKNILMTLTDATNLAEMEREVKLSQSLLKILQSSANFKSLLSETFLEFERTNSLIDQEGQKDVKILLHTIKGNFASYGLDDIADLAHHIEDKARITTEDISQLVDAISAFLETHKDLLKIDPESLHEREYALRDKHFESLLQTINSQGASQELIENCRKWVDSAKRISFRDLLGPVEKSVQRIASSVGKEVRLQVEGDQLAIDAERLQYVIHSLIHVIRNCIDHGLEHAHERGKKDPVGTIFIRCWRADRHFFIDIGDDGAGIDAEKIREIALRKGLISEDNVDSFSRDQLLQLIFHAGFSTREEVTSISGRGVGMSALQDAVLEQQGKIDIDTSLGEGTCFHIVIPDAESSEEIEPMRLRA